MSPPAPAWLGLLVPLPSNVVPQRKPVASAEQLANGNAGPIAGWQSITVNLSEPAYGLRHVQVTLDENGQLLSGGDHVMFVRETTPDDNQATLTDHESVGGRFEPDIAKQQSKRWSCFDDAQSALGIGKPDSDVAEARAGNDRKLEHQVVIGDDQNAGRLIIHRERIS